MTSAVFILVIETNPACKKAQKDPENQVSKAPRLTVRIAKYFKDLILYLLTLGDLSHCKFCRESTWTNMRENLGREVCIGSCICETACSQIYDSNA